MPIYHFHIVDGREVQDPRGLDLPTDDAARRYGQQLANGLRPVWLAVGGEKRTFVRVVNESGITVAKCRVEG
jgi:hypothetical protein